MFSFDFGLAVHILQQPDGHAVDGGRRVQDSLLCGTLSANAVLALWIPPGVLGLGHPLAGSVVSAPPSQGRRPQQLTGQTPPQLRRRRRLPDTGSKVVFAMVSWTPSCVGSQA